MTYKDPPPLLSFGIMVGGASAQNEPIDQAIARIGLRIHDLQGSFPNRGLRVNFVFQIPGPLDQPDFSGIHLSRLRRQDSLMLINVAVPSDLQAKEVPGFVRDRLTEGAKAAKSYVARRKIQLDTESVEAAVTAITRELTG